MSKSTCNRVKSIDLGADGVSSGGLWCIRYSNLLDNKLELPEYYLKPFHAYKEGNLCWQAAMEVSPSSLTLSPTGPQQASHGS
jgi:hypothetical protein